MGKDKPRLERGTIKIGRRSRGIIWWSRPSTISIIFSVLAIFLLVTGLTLGGVPVIWMAWYRISPETSSRLAQVLARPLGEGQSFENPQDTQPIPSEEAYQPPLDESLPQENRLTIKSIGLDTLILEETAQEYETALRKGVWRVPDFGTSYQRTNPMILVAHRFGYLAWSVPYRLKNSFFNLPKLKPGDTIEVIWNQRKYVYEVFAGDEGKEIGDYQADLILYTCKFLESDVRIFRYARLVEE